MSDATVQLLSNKTTEKLLWELAALVPEFISSVGCDDIGESEFVAVKRAEEILGDLGIS